MLSAVIDSELSYRALQLASQPTHQRFVHSGPLVLGATPFNHPSPTADRDQHRGAKHRRRYELLGGISLLSPEYLLSVERWPFHSEPPDHYDLLSHLLDSSVSQLSWLMPLHYPHDVRP